jgi:hypothetical protein
MSRPRFLADQDLNDAIVSGVVRLEPSIEFVRLRDCGLEELPDEQVLRYAVRERWIVVSHDVSSMTAAASGLLAANEPMQGLLLVHQSHPVAPTIDSLVLIWSASEAEEWIGLIEYLPI